jgi:hypothetical protein
MSGLVTEPTEFVDGEKWIARLTANSSFKPSGSTGNGNIDTVISQAICLQFPVYSIRQEKLADGSYRQIKEKIRSLDLEVPSGTAVTIFRRYDVSRDLCVATFFLADRHISLMGGGSRLKVRHLSY